MTQQTSYGERTDFPADAGKRIGVVHPDAVRPYSAGGGSQKVTTIVVDTAANATTYSYTCNGGLVSYLSDASATKIEIADGLADAHNALVAANSAAVASSDGVDTVTITGREVGDDYSISESDANLTLATTTAASTGTAIPFGVGVVETALPTTGGAPAVCGLPSLGTAQILTATPAAVNDAIYTITITGDFTGTGTAESYDAVYQADATATVAEITAGLTAAGNIVMPANSVLFADGTTLVTLTGEVAGQDWEATGGGSLAGATITFATTTAAARDEFAGVAMKTQLVESAITGGSAEYAPNDVVSAMEDGELWVLLDSGQSPALTDSVFLRASASGSEQAGAFRTDVDGGDAYLLPNCYWTRPAQTALDGTSTIAALKVRRS